MLNKREYPPIGETVFYDRLENGPFIPAHQQLLKGGIVYIALHEAADIGIPPGNAGQADVQAGGQLIAQRFKGARHVPGPEDVAVLLAARPAGAEEVHHVLVAQRGFIVKEGPAVILRIDVAAGQSRPHIIAEIVKVILGQIRLRIIQPEGVDPQVVIMLLALLPDILPGFRVGRVDLNAVPLIIVGLHGAPFGAH